MFSAMCTDHTPKDVYAVVAISLAQRLSETDSDPITVARFLREWEHLFIVALEKPMRKYLLYARHMVTTTTLTYLLRSGQKQLGTDALVMVLTGAYCLVVEHFYSVRG